MAVNYNKLWKLLIDKGMTKTQSFDGCSLKDLQAARL